MALVVAAALSPAHHPATTRRARPDRPPRAPAGRAQHPCGRPPHLLKSWTDQVAAVLPGARVQILERQRPRPAGRRLPPLPRDRQARPRLGGHRGPLPPLRADSLRPPRAPTPPGACAARPSAAGPPTSRPGSPTPSRPCSPRRCPRIPSSRASPPARSAAAYVPMQPAPVRSPSPRSAISRRPSRTPSPPCRHPPLRDRGAGHSKCTAAACYGGGGSCRGGGTSRPHPLCATSGASSRASTPAATWTEGPPCGEPLFQGVPRPRRRPAGEAHPAPPPPRLRPVDR